MNTNGDEPADRAATECSSPMRRHHHPWVGVLTSFLIPGAAQFLSGRRRLGLAWLLGLWALSLLGDGLLASARIPGIIPGGVILASALAFWMVMLAKSWLPVPRLRFVGWVSLLAVSAGILFARSILLRHIAQPFYMPTSSMVPTIRGEHAGEDGSTNRGDSVVVDCTAYWFAEPKLGDMVVFRTEGIVQLPDDQVYIKRVVGIPGDKLSIRDGCLLNHGEKVAVPAAAANLRFVEQRLPAPLLSEESAPFLVPPDTLFVVGDNTENSLDSRHYGPIPVRNIVGRVTKIYWPLSRAGDVK